MISSNVHLQTKREGKVAVVSFVDRLIADQQIVEEISDELRSLPEELVGCNLALDFSGVRFMTSAVLGPLILLERNIGRLGGKLVMCGLYKEYLEMLQLIKLDKFFIIQFDLQAALRYFG